MTIYRALLEQALEALEAMQSYAAAERKLEEKNLGR